MALLMVLAAHAMPKGEGGCRGRFSHRLVDPIMVRHGLLQQSASLNSLLDDRFLPDKDF